MDLEGQQHGIRRLIEAHWQGPFSWPGYESVNGLERIPKIPGVYLQTFEYQEGYLIHVAGITRRPIPTRFREHTRKILNGEYNILVPERVSEGVREEVWHGWGYARNHRAEFAKRKSEIVEGAERMLAAFRVFVTDVGTEERLLERIEASIMNHLWNQQPPICDIPDIGMQLAARWDNENPIIVNNHSTCRIHGLPEQLSV